MGGYSESEADFPRGWPGWAGLIQSARRLQTALGQFLIFLGSVIAAPSKNRGLANAGGDNWDPPAPAVEAPVAESQAAAVVPERAAVRPRIFSPETGEAMPLEDEILPWVQAHDWGAIRILGPPGSGKTTALRHLADVIPPRPGLRFLDDPDATLGSEGPPAGLVVYASNTSAFPSHLADYRLATWGDDELIEYLLAAAKDRCGSVMARLKDAKDGELLEGIPELWRLVLDRMAGDPTVPGARHALRRELVRRLADPGLRALVQDYCLASLVRPDDAVAPWLSGTIERDNEDAILRRLIRYRPIRILLAAERIAAELGSDATCASLSERLPRDLVQETAVWIRTDPRAVDRLERVLRGGDSQPHRIAASLLHAARVGWRPTGRPLPDLSGAYLEQADWGGIDLVEASLAGVDLSSADLSEAKLDKARAASASFLFARLRGASLEKIDARVANFAGADLSSIHGERARFSRANLEGANLTGASLRRASLNSANLTKACFVGTDLIKARLKGARIEGADFTGAKLESAVLSGLKLNEAEFADAHFADADLSGCDLEGMKLPNADFEDAHLKGALLTGSQMPRANFRGADLQETGLAEIDCEGACLADANLKHASFHLGSSRSGLVSSPIACEGSRTGFYTDDFHDQDFKSPEEIRKANLCGADLRGAEVLSVDFYLVDLRGAHFDFHQAEHFRRCGAILGRA
jgi:uncharacterized protein YjbI with pentapeptide repeats